MQKIITHLWFDHQAEEAVNFYTSVFERGRILEETRYDKEGAEISARAQGSVMTVTFELAGQEFIALNGGPYFTITPAISFFVDCVTEKELDKLWDKLIQDGLIFMELGPYPFSKKFGWVQDRFGVSWQLNLEPYGNEQTITPFLMFTGDRHGKAEEAVDFYISLFDQSKKEAVERYGADEEEIEGTTKHVAFTLGGQKLIALDGGRDHPFTFSEAISLMVVCQDQKEVDKLWEMLSEAGEKSRCGWLKDRYGVSWQIVPALLGDMLHDPDMVKAQRVMQAMLSMDKIDIAVLQKAYEGK